MMNKFQKIIYEQLKARQQENFNFQKVSAILADYGFNTLRLTDDWQGADFIANHIDGETFIKVQLKGRFILDKKYIGKNIWVCFPLSTSWYMYPHDVVMQELKSHSNYEKTSSWKEKGLISNGKPTKKDLELLEKYRLEVIH